MKNGTTTTAAAKRVGILLAVLSLSVLASSDTPSPAVLFLNVLVFDGKSGEFPRPTNVPVRGNIIERISAGRTLCALGC